MFSACRIVIFILIFGLISAGCSEPEQETNKQYRVTWVNDQTLLINQLHSSANWLYSLDKKHLLRLPRRLSYDKAKPSSSGRHVFSTNWEPHGNLSLLSVDNADTLTEIKTFEIPEMPIVDPDEEKVHSKQSFWISEQQIYLEHFNVMSGRFQCQIFDIRTRLWTVTKNCLNLMEFPGTANRIDYLGQDLYSIRASAEGQVSVRIIKWTPATGLVKANYPELRLGMNVQIHFYFNKGDAKLYALSSVPLHVETDEEPNIDYSKQDRVLYKWSDDKNFIETDVKLKPGVALKSVDSNKTAWVNSKKQQLCIGTLTQKKDCYDIKL